MLSDNLSRRNEGATNTPPLPPMKTETADKPANQPVHIDISTGEGADLRTFQVQLENGKMVEATELSSEGLKKIEAPETLEAIQAEIDKTELDRTMVGYNRSIDDLLEGGDYF